MITDFTNKLDNIKDFLNKNYINSQLFGFHSLLRWLCLSYINYSKWCLKITCYRYEDNIYKKMYLNVLKVKATTEQT